MKIRKKFAPIKWFGQIITFNGCTKKIRVITRAKGKNGGHVLPLRKLRDLSKDPLRVPQVFPINVKGNTLPFFSETFWCTPFNWKVFKKLAVGYVHSFPCPRPLIHVVDDVIIR